MKLKANNFFVKTFILLFLTMFISFALFSIYLYTSSRKIIEDEFINSSIQSLENIADHVDRSIKDSQSTLSTFVANELVVSLCSPSSLDLTNILYTNYTNRIEDIFLTTMKSNEELEAIYLYSEYKGLIYSYSGATLAGTHYDRYWLDSLNPDLKGISIFPYSMLNLFPHTLCIAREFETNDYQSIICLLLNVSKLPLVRELEANNQQQFFIINDENQVIYRKQQEKLKESLTVSEHLIHYDTSTTQNASIYFNSDNIPYSFVQKESSTYPWTYVLYTPLPDYTSKLSASRALASTLCFIFILFSAFVASFFSLRSLKPVRNIRRLLDSPELFSYDDTKDSSADIQYIAVKITQYIQTNQQLAEELNKRLNLLQETQKQALQLQINPHFLFNTLTMMQAIATDSLGYDHALPTMTLHLSSLLRYSLEPSYMVTLQTELSYNNIYLQILNYRYGENLNVIQSIDQEVLLAKVPKLFIQPIIENAVFHGFSKQHDRECKLTIHCFMQEKLLATSTSDKFICLQITDNGIGIKEKTLTQLRDMLAGKASSNGKSIGLQNVSQRLKLFFADAANITIDSIPNQGTCFTITFPFIT